MKDAYVSPDPAYAINVRRYFAPDYPAEPVARIRQSHWAAVL